MSSRLYLTQREQAYDLLYQATAQTPPEIVAWAVGVVQFSHAMYLANLRRLDPWLAPTAAGGNFGPQPTRFYSADGRGYAAFADPGDMLHNRPAAAIFHVTWTQVYALLNPARIGPRLVAEIADAMATRKQRTPTHDSRRPMDWYKSEQAQTEHRLWREIEIRCEDVAAEVWQACRPAQLSPGLAEPTPAPEPQARTTGPLTTDEALAVELLWSHYGTELTADWTGTLTKGYGRYGVCPIRPAERARYRMRVDFTADGLSWHVPGFGTWVIAWDRVAAHQGVQLSAPEPVAVAAPPRPVAVAVQPTLFDL